MYEYKVSVIVPVFNAQNFLKRCIDSILVQTLKETELILVNDDSTDQSPDLCDEYARLNPNIKVIHKKNEGPGYARNCGINIASGEYIAFVDADDYIAPDMYEKMYLKAAAAGADSCICGYYKVDEKGKHTANLNPMGNRIFDRDEVHKEILMNIIGSKPEYKQDHIIGLSVWKNLYSARIIKEKDIRFYSERVYYSEDTLFNIDYFSQSQKVVSIEEGLYYYTENPSSFTRNYKEDMHMKNVRFYKLALEKLERIPESYDARIRLNRLFLGFVRYYLQRIVELYDRHTAIHNIRAIVNDETLSSLIRDYPYRRNPLKQRIIHHFIDHKQAVLLWLFISLHDLIPGKRNPYSAGGNYEKNVFYCIFRRTFRGDIET